MRKKSKKKLRWNYKVCLKNLFHAMVCILGILLTAINLIIVMNLLYNS